MKARLFTHSPLIASILVDVCILLIPLLSFAAITDVVIVSTQSWQSTGVQVTQGTVYGVWQTSGYCWSTPKCRNLGVQDAFFEGKKAEETAPRKSTPRTLKEVGQQYPSGEWTVDSRFLKPVDGAGYSPRDDAKIYQGCKLYPSWPYGLLLGKVGGSIFPIGRVAVFIAPANGVLELAIHDLCLADNAGVLSVSFEAGLDAQGVLHRYINDLVENLTPEERTRLSIQVKNMSACNVASANASSIECDQVMLGILSLHSSPYPQE
jgi:hypothetical protein